MSELFKNYHRLFKKDLNTVDKINKKLLWVLNSWIGNHKTNLKLALDIEEGILKGVPKSILLKELFLRVNKNIKRIKYPKKIKKEERKYDWLEDYFRRYYNWSKREWELYYFTIYKYLNDKQFKLNMARKFGLNKKERKLLGLKEIKIKQIEKIKQVKLI